MLINLYRKKLGNCLRHAVAFSFKFILWLSRPLTKVHLFLLLLLLLLVMGVSAGGLCKKPLSLSSLEAEILSLEPNWKMWHTDRRSAFINRYSCQVIFWGCFPDIIHIHVPLVRACIYVLLSLLTQPWFCLLCGADIHTLQLY